jgi:hypothetical protein
VLSVHHHTCPTPAGSRPTEYSDDDGDR